MKLIYDALERAGIILPRWLHIVIIVCILLWAFCKYVLPFFKKIHITVNECTDAVQQIGKVSELETKVNEISDTVQKTVEETEKEERKLESDIETLSMSIAEIQQQISENTMHLGKISAVLEEMEIKDDEQKKNTLKDRISQSYRYYHQRGEWNSIEKESLEGLIAAYEACRGGDNSFVHSVVQKEMYTWKVTDEE